MRSRAVAGETSRESRVVRLLLATDLAFNLGFYMVVPFLAGALEAMTMSATAIGVVLGLRGLAQQGLFLFGGLWAERHGYRPAILLGCSLRVVGLALFALSGSLPTLATAAVLMGVGAALFTPSLRAYLTAGANDRTRAFALSSQLSQAGAVLGPVLGVALLSLGFAAVATAAAAVFFAWGAVLWRWLPPLEPDAAAVLDGKPPRQRAIFLVFCAAMAGYAMVFNQLYYALPLALERAGANGGTTGAMFVCSGLTAVLMQTRITAALKPRLAPARAIAAGLAVMSASMLPLAASAGSPMAILACTVVLTVGMTMAFPFAMSVIGHLSGERAVATHFGAFYLVSGIGGAAGNLIVGRLLDADAIQASFAVIAAVPLGAALVMLALGRRLGAVATAMAVVAVSAGDVHAGDGARALPRLREPIVVDGVDDEPAWRELAPLPVTVYEPTYGASSSQRSEFRVAYDDRALYLLVRAFDDDPADVRANSLERDVYAGDDTVGLIVDPFGDDNAGLWFYTTPAGNRTDGTIAADMASGEPDWSWDAPWESAARVTDDGWIAELRVPFRTLGFRDADSLVHMGISVYRWLPRHNERHIWPDVPPRWPRAYAKPSRLQDIVLYDVAAEPALQLAPYSLAGYDAASPGLPAEPRLEAGLDAKYAWSNTSTLDLTLNTDFAQAEADDARINLTRFPLFFREKRQFFLERAGVFDVRLGGQDRLFHSRRIGLVDGEPVRILGGARLILRAGRWDFGLLDMQTAARGEARGENLAVARVRRLLGDGTSSVGAITTSRVDNEGARSVVTGGDAVVRVVGDDYLTATFAYSAGRSEAGESAGQGSRLLVDWERRRLQGLRYALAVDHGDSGFEPALGYQKRRGFSAATGLIGHRWLSRAGWPDALAWLSAVALAVDGQMVLRAPHEALDTARVTPSLSVQTRRGHELAIGSEHAREDVPEPFALTEDAVIPAGAYSMHRTRVDFAMSSGVRLRTGLSLEAGDFYGGHSFGAVLLPTWNASRHMNLAGRYEANAIELANGTTLTTQLASVRARLALDTHLSLSLLAQYTSVGQLGTMNARFRLHAREGRDFWLVVNASNRLSEPSRAPIWQVMAKYTHTLQL